MANIKRRKQPDIKKVKRRFLALMSSLDYEEPDKKDLAELIQIIRNNSDLWRNSHGFSKFALKSTLSCYAGKTVSLFYLAEAEALKKELRRGNANPLEKLIIDQIIICWVRMQCTELSCSQKLSESHTTEIGEYWQGMLTRHQSRYLKAVETLTRVRKLNNSIALQLNIATDGGKQVNINKPGET